MLPVCFFTQHRKLKVVKCAKLFGTDQNEKIFVYLWFYLMTLAVVVQTIASNDKVTNQ
jgi:hypothetical protein